jgi:hypothetical protein
LQLLPSAPDEGLASLDLDRAWYLTDDQGARVVRPASGDGIPTPILGEGALITERSF